MTSPLTHYVNRFGDATRFIERWDARIEARAHSGSTPHAAFCQHSGAILTSSHPDFLSRVDPGVQSLVRQLVFGQGWITYSSCEGHPPAGEHAFMPRHAGLLPRNQVELQRQRRMLYDAAARCNADNSEGVAVSIRDVTLESKDESLHPVLDILFVPTESISVYFAILDTVTNLFIDKLIQVARL